LLTQSNAKMSHVTCANDSHVMEGMSCHTSCHTLCHISSNASHVTHVKNILVADVNERRVTHVKKNLVAEANANADTNESVVKHMNRLCVTNHDSERMGSYSK